MATEELGFDVVVKDKGGNEALEKVGRTSASVALKIDQANIRVEKSARSAGLAEQKYGKNSLEARDAAVKLAASQQNLERAMAGTQEAASGAGDEVKKFSSALGLVGIGAAAGAGAAIAKALDIEAGVDKLQGQLGATVKEAERYGKIAGEVYGANFGENLEQVNDAIKNVRQNIGDLGDTGSSSMQSITEDTLSLAQAFGVDLFDVTKAAGTLLRTGLAPDAQYALDLITVGLQKVPGAAEDLLDTFTEYSVQFKALGLTGDQALAFISEAMKGGARNTDLAADALKEFNLRAKDTTNIDAQGAIEELGLSAERTATAIAGGGTGAVTAMAELLSRLREVPDPADRARLATALLGTQAEDLQEALFAVDPQQFTKGLDGVAGSADRLNATLGDNGAARIETYRRQLELMVTEAAGIDGPMGTAAAAVAAFGGSALGAAGAIAPVIGGIGLIPGVAPRATALMTRLGGAFGRATSLISANRGAVLKGVAAFAILSTTLELLKPDFDESAAGIGAIQLALDRLEAGQGGNTGLGSLGDDFKDIGAQLREFSDPSVLARVEDASFALGGILHLGGSGDGRLQRQEAVADFKALDQALAGLVGAGNTAEAARQFQLLNKQAVAGGAGVDQLSNHLPAYNDAVAAAASATGGAVTPVKDLARGMQDQGSAAAGAAKSQAELNKTLVDYASYVLGVRGSQRDFEAAIDAASASVKTNGKTLDITTAKGRDNAAALDSIAEKGIALAQQTPKGADAQRYFASTIGKTRERLVAAAHQMGLSKTAAGRLADKILDIPSKKKVTISSNADAQKSKVRALISQVDHIDGRNATYTITEVIRSENRRDAATARRYPARATGGPVSAGVTYLVGERGQELFVPKQNGTILPEVPAPGLPARSIRRHQFEDAIRSTPTRHDRIELAIRSGGTKMDDLLVDLLRKSIRIKGGNVQVVLGTGNGRG